MSAFRLLDLFSGIGGFSLGLERSGGFKTVAFCEIEPFCRQVLRKHWPDVPIYEDVRTLTADRLAADGIAVDAICGGFPCQDISVAGKRAGIEGERSGLWKEYARIIGELRPQYVIVENVAALLGRGLSVVLGDLAAVGYDAEWHCIPASAIGAPHRRDRLWIVAYPGSVGVYEQSVSRAERESQILPDGNGAVRNVAYAERSGRGESPLASSEEREPLSQTIGKESSLEFGSSSKALADANSGDEHGRRRTLQVGWGRIASEVTTDGDAGRTQWGFEPDVGRVAHGVPRRVDRLRGLGNAVVPQIPELIGRAILATARPLG